MTSKDEDDEPKRRKRWWEDRDFIPTGPKRVTKGGNTFQEGIAFIPIQHFPEPEEPKTVSQQAEPGWIEEKRRDSSSLRVADWNFKNLIDSGGEENLAACAWYEYARECAKVRAVAGTYSVHYRLASGMGRRDRCRQGKDRWTKERAENQAKREDMARRLFASLHRRIDGLKRDGKHKFAEEFGRKWYWKINAIECHDPTPTFNWMTRHAWMRISWLQNQLEQRCARLAEKADKEAAEAYENKWKPRLEKMMQAARAWEDAEDWMGRIEGKCSIGAPSLHTLAHWLHEDCPWQEIVDAKDPNLDVCKLAIERGPKATDAFSRTGKGRHPIPGLSGGLQLERGFATVSPKSAFFNRTGRYGELLSDDRHWTDVTHFKKFRSETFVGKIVWNRPDNEIMKDFEKWLKWRRSLQPEPFSHMGKRESRSLWDDPAAALKDLAALRMRAHFGATVGSVEWAKLYSPDEFDKRLNNGSIERQARRAAADAATRFGTWMADWHLDSDTKTK
ncbi:MAG: hypothetical protein R3F13_10910 [Prosthecobacter sp.]